MQPLLHLEQFLFLFCCELRNGDTGERGDDLRDVFDRHFVRAGAHLLAPAVRRPL